MKTSGKYVQIADQLTQKIIEQAYFDRLPPVRDLAQEYNVSLRTIQKALELLAQRTLIEQFPRIHSANYKHTEKAVK